MFAYNDGGREASGFKGSTGDCVCRAIAIAAGRDYQTVYDELAYLCSMTLTAHSHPRTGIHKSIYRPYLEELGFEWHPIMKIGSGTTVHLMPGELPRGVLIARLSKHLCAVIDGVAHDTHDPSRGGTRCVYGYWTRP